MDQEVSPDTLFDPEAERRTDTLAEFANRADPGTEPAPEDLPLVGPAPVSARLSLVSWPEDARAPDYAWLADHPEPAEFDLTPAVLQGLVRSGSYSPHTDRGLVAFALRGARLVDGHEAVRESSVRLATARPDHRNFRCVLGFWHVGEGRVTAFTGSTVPCRLAIAGFAGGGDASNMLPTGCFTTYVWRHKTLRPALRMSTGNASDGALEAGAEVCVLRSRNNLTMELTDIFDRSVPLDNVHCSYFLSENERLGAAFSSWGCLTVRGLKDPSDQWKTYQSILSSHGSRNRLDLIVATGKEAALVGSETNLLGLRQGSQGEAVSRLQQALGIAQNGFFGPATADRFTGRERSFNEERGRGRTAGGVLTPMLAEEMGLEIFQMA